MELFTWVNGEVPENLQTKQVYGVCFMEDGRIMLRVDNRNEMPCFGLAGGRPEVYDKDREETLKREYIEEVNTKVKDIRMCGYLEVIEPSGIPPYAQVRMIALIDEIGELKPDPDTDNVTWGRFLTTPEKAKKYLNWGKAANQMIDESVRLAAKYFGITTYKDFDEYV